MEGNVMMGKYLEYFEDIDLDMLVDHCLWHNARESVESGGTIHLEINFSSKVCSKSLLKWSPSLRISLE